MVPFQHVFHKLRQTTASELLLVKISKQIAVAADGTLKTPFTREVKDVVATPVTAVTINGTPKVGTALSAVPTAHSSYRNISVDEENRL